MIMFRVHFANNRSLDISAETPEQAKVAGLRQMKGFGVTKVKRLKEQPQCYPFSSTSLRHRRADVPCPRRRRPDRMEGLIMNPSMSPSLSEPRDRFTIASDLFRQSAAAEHHGAFAESIRLFELYQRIRRQIALTDLASYKPAR